MRRTAYTVLLGGTLLLGGTVGAVPVLASSFAPAPAKPSATPTGPVLQHPDNRAQHDALPDHRAQHDALPDHRGASRQPRAQPTAVRDDNAGLTVA